MLPNARAAPNRPASSPDARQAANQNRVAKPPKVETRVIIARGDRLQAVHFSPRLMAVAGACFVLFSVFYFASTAYLVFRDDWLRQDSGAEAVLRETYEDRISALRNEIERITSRRMVDHATVEQKVEQLLDRQDELGQRQDMLARLTEAARKAGFDVAPPPPPRKDGKQASADDAIAVPSLTLASAAGGTQRDPLAPLPGTDRIASIESDIAAMETAQDATVTKLASGVTTRADRIAALLKRVGRKVPRPLAEDDVGGPFVPLPMATEPDRFASGVAVLSAELDRLATVRKVALSLPWSQPIANAPISSGFGPRLDPFLGRPAMHTGIDFRAPRDYPARAVAAGRVIAAEWNGGYGNMVDVDHGNGVVTRYGHLASISVRVGDNVAAGGKIGRVGSTGRSTGPHLHYEIRVDGEAIDPMRFLIAGKEMTQLL
ncbi:Murein DD-endopeptidase MepM and murein hydrolase activator NlpD, contain LysM domain [Kaistia soli DSM 19436]|uniref:Murein DD-endopeptidase MepM and murein hydrolase activator NlpD, contain LysM domain n=1 Tax=Kaistia soli DSM 19436 TaxID=1122133 RepID=A0A1M5GY63_9HYPH|nr:M23 family metallopeptidase [Kaistia soli]SHG08676.1 Murein DD-endopeptidase MepM and murein hydrolase activator NlpD, contain LysM domain [Kaistia soli DSM 19436]